MPAVTTRLIERELEVSEMREAGYSYDRIAQLLGITKFTVRDHAKRAERKRAIAADRYAAFLDRASRVPPR
jgi:DNA-binding CsgD family transcriptional regulator